MAGWLNPDYIEAANTAFLAGKTLKLCLIDTADHTFDGTERYLSDITEAAIVCTSDALQNVTCTGLAIDCDDPTISAVTGDPPEQALYYIDTGVAATSQLIGYGAVSVVPTLSGADIVVRIPSGGFLQAAA